jgi:hypothetical protein
VKWASENTEKRWEKSRSEIGVPGEERWHESQRYWEEWTS